MPAARKPGIDADELSDRTLSDISAADFLKALGESGGVGMHALHHWPEKKKYELLLEPEDFGGVRVADLIRGVREKKKFELEKPPGVEIDFKPGREDWWRDPRQALRDPEFIREIAREVAIQLRRMG